MNKRWIMMACLSLLAGGAVLRAADQPANPPALPAGHPSVAGKPASGAAMPAGHPDISTAQDGAALPSGHPDISKMPGAADGGTLPAGHPSVDALRAAATQPAGSGSLEIRVLQGTKGAAAIGADAATVEIYGEGSKLLKTVDTKLDAKGLATLQISLDAACQPVVRIMHRGIAYEGVGRVMDREHRSQRMDMTVFEPADKQPDLAITMRHVLVHVAPEGLHVTEMLAISNPSDRTWVGTESGDKHTSFTVPFPAGVKDLTAVGQPDGAVELRGNQLVSLFPLLPGSTELQVEYVVPMTAGKADLTITAPAPVGTMYVFIPDDGSTVTTTGLDAMGVRPTGQGSKRAYKAASLKAGQEAKLSFSGLKAAAEPVKKSDAGSSHLPQIAAGVGAGTVILVGIIAACMKSPAAGKSKTAA